MRSSTVAAVLFAALLVALVGSGVGGGLAGCASQNDEAARPASLRAWISAPTASCPFVLATVTRFDTFDTPPAGLHAQYDFVIPAWGSPAPTANTTSDSLSFPPILAAAFISHQDVGLFTTNKAGDAHITVTGVFIGAATCTPCPTPPPGLAGNATGFDGKVFGLTAFDQPNNRTVQVQFVDDYERFHTLVTANPGIQDHLIAAYLAGSHVHVEAIPYGPEGECLLIDHIQFPTN